MNKGFKALPEYVQRKIDPEMAKKYMGGGAVLQRPLFRQAGGPAQPMPQDIMPAAPAPMASPVPEEQILMEVEGGMEAEGRDYINKMMGGIDAADDVVSMINALRGNEAPLESRYAELAQYVGEADAQKTPESVLAMVQPTIMMTEEGVVDSGIGAMMREIADASMENEMGQGVGQLMMMGAGNTPPANFSQGGPVHLQTGGDPSLEQMYQQRLKMRQDILGGTDQQAELDRARDLSQSQFFFDLANAALAAGAPTAQPMSAAERIMGGLQQSNVFGNLGQSAREVEALKRAQSAEEKQMALSALTSAEGAFETAQQRALELQKQQNQFAQELTIQTNKFKHDVSLQDDAQSHAAKMQSNSEELQKALVKLQGNETQAAIKLRGELQEELAKTNADLQINNQLRAMKQANVYDIAKMDKGLEQSQALASYNATLDRIAADSQRAFTATQNALNRALQENLQLGSQDFEANLRKELKQMDLDDRAIDRQVAKVQNDIANAFQADAALRADQTLALQQLIAQNDQDYRANQQIIDQYKAETARIKEERLADEGKSVTVPAGASVYKDGVLQFTAPKDATASTKVLGPGEVLMDATGKVLGRGPDKPASTTSVQYQLPDGSIELVYAGSPEEKDLMNTPGVKRVSITGSDYDLLTDVDVMNQYAAGETDPTITAKIQAAIVEAGQPKPGSNVTPDLPNLVMESEQKRAILGLPTQISVPDMSAEEQAMLASNLPFEQIGGKAFGTRAFFGNLVNKGAGIFMLGAPASEVQDAIKQVERLNENAKVAFRDMTAGRSQEAVNQFANILPKTTAFTESPSAAAAAVQATVDFYKQQLDLAQADLKTIGSFSERQKAENAIEQSKAMIQSYESLLLGINRFLKKDGRKPLSDF